MYMLMYHDISSTVIMLRQFDQSVPAHKNKSAKGRLGNTMNPALIQEFHIFCEQEQLQKHPTLDKKSYEKSERI